jgi:hypothetical protein
MLTGVAAYGMPRTIHAPGAWVFLVVVLVLIVLIFVLMYGRRGR